MDVSRAERDGVDVRIIAGEAFGVRSPVYTRTPTMYLDFTLKPGAQVHQRVPEGWNAFVYVLEGEGVFGGAESSPVAAHHTLVLGAGDGLSAWNRSMLPPGSSMAQLAYLFLEYNRLTGPISPDLDNSPSLTILNLRGNLLSGAMPRELFEQPSLAAVLLSGNLFRGPIPAQLCVMRGLRMLDLSANSFSGAVPRCLSDVAAAEPTTAWSRWTSSSGPRAGCRTSKGTISTRSPAWICPETS